MTVALGKLERFGKAQRTKGGRDQGGRQLRDRWKLVQVTVQPETDAHQPLP